MSLRERTRPGLGIIEPCLPSPAKVPPSGEGWLHEIKHDGFRILAHRGMIGGFPMRPTVLVLTAALLWPVTVFSETTEIHIGYFVSGNDLFHVCSDGRDRQICEAYVKGVTDTIGG
jgi:hypothetical protein